MFFQAEQVMPHVIRIRGVADTMMYLVEGTAEALLIDTGCGAGDLRAFVSTLTDKPVTVVLTHGHMDHAMGAKGFERVYLSPLDREVYQWHSRPEIQRGYPESIYRQGAPRPEQPIRENDWMEPLPVGELLALGVGDTFYLGGVTARIMEGAGHTPGCVTVLLPELRTLILGDACNSLTFLFEACSSTVSAYRDMLLRLRQSTAGCYDRVLFLHRSGEGELDMVHGVLSVCEEVLAGRSDAVPFPGFDGTQAAIAKKMTPFPDARRVDGRVGNLVYDPKRIY